MLRLPTLDIQYGKKKKKKLLDSGRLLFTTSLGIVALLGYSCHEKKESSSSAVPTVHRMPEDAQIPVLENK